MWHVIHDDGDEEDLDENEVNDCLCVLDEDILPKFDDGAENEMGKQNVDFDEPPDIAQSYYNKSPGGLSIKLHQIDIRGLAQEMLMAEECLAEGLKSKGSLFVKEKKRSWISLVGNADDLPTLRRALIVLEEIIHETQVIPDKLDEVDAMDKRKVMSGDGWVFDPVVEGGILLSSLQRVADEAATATTIEYVSPRLNRRGTVKDDSNFQDNREKCEDEFNRTKEGISFIGKRVRKFFPGHGISDGSIVGFLRGGLNDGNSLWHMEHDDGDCEDLDRADLDRALRYFESNAQEEDYCDGGVDDKCSTAGSSYNEDDGDESDGDEALATRDVLWPSLNARMHWLGAVNSSSTISEVALALSALMEYCNSYGIVAGHLMEGLGTRPNNNVRGMTRNSMRTPSRYISGAYGQVTVGSTKKFRTGSGGRRSSTKAAQGNKRILRNRASRHVASYVS